MADSPDTGQQTQQPANAPAPAADSADAKLQELQQQLKQTQNQYANLQQLQGRQTAELGQLRQIAQQYQGQQSSAPERGNGESESGIDPNELEAIKQEQGLISARQQFGSEWNKYEAEVMQIANDPTRAPDFAVTRGGKVQYTASYSRIIEHLQARDLRKAREAVAQHPEESRSAATSREATISGVSASEPPKDSGAMNEFLKAAENADISSDELMRLGIKAGVYKVDPANPPKFRDGKTN